MAAGIINAGELAKPGKKEPIFISKGWLGRCA
jgi:hypothetical protein